jgi:hypothetical protein
MAYHVTDMFFLGLVCTTLNPKVPFLLRVVRRCLR